jgi:hypothetical protein
MRKVGKTGIAKYIIKARERMFVVTIWRALSGVCKLELLEHREEELAQRRNEGVAILTADAQVLERSHR